MYMIRLQFLWKYHSNVGDVFKDKYNLRHKISYTWNTKPNCWYEGGRIIEKSNKCPKDVYVHTKSVHEFEVLCCQRFCRNELPHSCGSNSCRQADISRAAFCIFIHPPRCIQNRTTPLLCGAAVTVEERPSHWQNRVRATLSLAGTFCSLGE